MARKSIKGYAEKNYYDNTKFNGITAISDPLNEGNFKHLVNFDIADSGQSLTPRKGFLTTDIFLQKTDSNGNLFEERLNIYADKYIYFYDTGIGQYIIYDPTSVEGHPYGRAYKIYFNLKNKYFTASEISTIESDLDYAQVWEIVKPYAELVYDQYQIRRSLTKIKVDDTLHWIELAYRENETIYETQEFSSDTLVITKVPMDDYVSINMQDRNIASKMSIIPDPIQVVNDDVLYNQFPLIYIKDNNNKYVLNTIKQSMIKQLSIIPYFSIIESIPNYFWGYTYDIISTQPYSTGDIYKAPLYRLDDNTEFSINTVDMIKDYIKSKSDPDISKTYQNITWEYDHPYFGSEFVKNTIVVHVVPKLNTNISASWSPNSLVSTADNPTEFMKACADNGDCYGVYVNSIFDTLKDTKYWSTIDYTKLDLKTDTIETLISSLKGSSILTNAQFYIQNVSELSEYDSTKGFVDSTTCKQTFFDTMFICKDRAGMSLSDFIKTLQTSTYAQIIFKFYESGLFFTSSAYDIALKVDDTDYSQFMPFNLFAVGSSTDPASNYVYFTCSRDALYADGFATNYLLMKHSSESIYRNLPKLSNYAFSQILNAYNTLTYTSIHFSKRTEDPSIFKKINNILYADTSVSDNSTLNKLFTDGYFSQGISIAFYLIQAPSTDAILSGNINTYFDTYDRELLIAGSNLLSTRTLSISAQTPTYIVEQLTEEPKDIETSKDFIIFKDSLGDHIVTWKDATLYISEPSTYYYFKYDKMFSYPERIIKVIQYKETLLVFTVQNLYSVYPIEDVSTVEDGVDDEGNTKYAQVKVITYGSLPVLYNLQVDEKYKDAIQVFNQMVLFYSSDGQLFMIKPTATIDNNTRFSVQYFNKSANDILANYELYIADRLESYGIHRDIEKSDVNIRVQVNINYIRIYYDVPNVITYILIYDVINNRYYVYDTMGFSDIKEFLSIETGDLIITEHENQLYFTTPYKVGVNADIAVYYNFREDDLNMELDTGVINLNNHLKKRFRTLRTIYKNLDATSINYNIETYIDDILAPIHQEDVVEAKPINGILTYVPTTVDNSVELLEDNTVLFNFGDYNSNKIITHHTNIFNVGKTIRFKLNFKSKGKFKFQGFGIVYKEHQI